MVKALRKEDNKMKIEYDPERDLLYIYFADTEKKSAETVTINLEGFKIQREQMSLFNQNHFLSLYKISGNNSVKINTAAKF